MAPLSIRKTQSPGSTGLSLKNKTKDFRLQRGHQRVLRKLVRVLRKGEQTWTRAEKELRKLERGLRKGWVTTWAPNGAKLAKRPWTKSQWILLYLTCVTEVGTLFRYINKVVGFPQMWESVGNGGLPWPAQLVHTLNVSPEKYVETFIQKLAQIFKGWKMFLTLMANGLYYYLGALNCINLS